MARQNLFSLIATALRTETPLGLSTPPSRSVTRATSIFGQGVTKNCPQKNTLYDCCNEGSSDYGFRLSLSKKIAFRARASAKSFS